ncbi:hypothetical protein BKP35_14140 [Anaerobacillus arseniciselenatis]|uniref:Uncharacterized protein n=1 Tax=Anaerobacillus arseniciselenatis TaxID=85682 RepID=A0A1S2LCL2_9BACI|nr:hypothetical protein [Anaerobacillus arseniciselenatis]OIJ10238.1 hypothetical protein BKP35_14140 [Anaerobacillus arseniciselenatis]
MDANRLTKRVTGINQHLQQFIDQTEDIYGCIYARLPEIETEIALNAEEMEILINYFVYNEMSDEETVGNKNDAYRLAQLLHDMRDSFSVSIMNMFDEKKLSRTIERFLTNNDSSEVDGLEQLMQIIEEIKEHITDIEIVSMNAIIHSTRLGDRGKAFGVISENIKDFSNQIEGQYGVIYEHSAKLSSWKDAFTEKLSHMLKYSDQLSNIKVEEFQNLFNEVFDSLKTVSQLLREANYNIELAVKPVQDLMIAIQSQDLIRQSLESVTNCLNSIFEGIDSVSLQAEEQYEDQLNFLTFVEKVIDLSINLLLSIQDQIEQSLRKVEEPILTIKASLDDTYEESSLVAEFLSGDRPNDNNTIEEIFIKVKGFIQNFKRELDTLKSDLVSFNEIGDFFYTEMTQIEQQFNVIKNKVGYLQRLNILSRIELARLDGEVGAFGNEIERISERVINDVNKNEQFVIDLKATLSGDLNQFFEMLKTNEHMIETMYDTAQQSLQNLNMIQQLVLDAVQPAGETGKKLIEEVDYLTLKMNQGKELPSSLQLITNDLIELSEEVGKSKLATLEKANLQEWSTTDKELNEIIEQLTTYYDRVAASNVLEDEEYDVGDEGGELTLF